MITPRQDQMEFIDGLRNAMRTHQAVMGCAATGFGKTVVCGYIARAALDKGKRVIFSVHRQELIHQTSKTFSAFGIPHGFIAAGMPYSKAMLVHIASIDTLQRRLDLVESPDLFVIDEAHLAMAKGWKVVADHFKARKAKVLGNSGSPQRLDGAPLRDLFDTLVEGPPPAWLIEQGHLSTYRYFAPSNPDLSGIKKQMGDYAKGELGEVMKKPKLTGDIVGHYLRVARGTRAVAFCVNIAHSQHVADTFNASGIPAAHIDGGTPKAERRKIIEKFADGHIKVLCNVELITTGFDLAAQVDRDVTIETVILIRPTQSLALHLQMVGRALRKKPYPAIILDHAGNSSRHGFPDDEREWSLDGKTKRKAANDNAPPPPVTCNFCFGQTRNPLPRCCPNCGKPFSVAETKPIEVADEDLQEVTDADKAEQRRQAKREQADAKTLDDLVNLGRKRGYQYPVQWAQKIWSTRPRRVAA